MYPKAICEHCKLSVTIFTLSLVVWASSTPDIGGGSGRVKTPYTPGRPVLVSEINQVKKIAAKTRTLRDVPIEGTHVPGAGKDVGLLYLKGARISGNPSFTVNGTLEDGGKASIDFSEIESIEVVQREDQSDRVLVEIVQFPIITAEELLERLPTYSDLLEHNRKTIRLWVNAQSAGKQLALVGKDETGRYKLISNLSAIAVNTKVPLDYGTFVQGQINLPSIWWAIESVTSDKKYPYRVVVKARP